MQCCATYLCSRCRKTGLLGLEIDLCIGKKASRIHLLVGITMKQILAGAALLLLTTSALAQGAPKAPTVGGKRLVHVKPIAPTGCKLVGTVKGTKLWAGDCVANELRSSSTGNEPAPRTGTVPAEESKKE